MIDCEVAIVGAGPVGLTLANLLAPHGPDAEAPIVRARVYAFRARTADRWWSGHIFLAGNEAHLTPPFAGQG